VGAGITASGRRPVALATVRGFLLAGSANVGRILALVPGLALPRVALGRLPPAQRHTGTEQRALAVRLRGRSAVEQCGYWLAGQRSGAVRQLHDDRVLVDRGPDQAVL